MSMMINLAALEGNDTTFVIQVTYNSTPINVPFFGTPTPLNLTGYTPKLYVKASSTTPDASATVYTTSNGLTVVSAALGELNFVLPRTAAATSGTQWWRLDVIDQNGNVGTALYGNLYILAV